jgi:hypothetical protein
MSKEKDSQEKTGKKAPLEVSKKSVLPKLPNVKRKVMMGK